MTKREFERRQHLTRALQALGFTEQEVESLRRISNTLQRWHEAECGTDNGCVERDEATGKAYWLNAHSGRRSPIADREAGAKKRLAAILAWRNARDWSGSPCPKDPANFWIDDATGERIAAPDGSPTPISAFIQTDPRGAALYILRPGDVPAGADASAYYSRGICVY